jgi:hypothetical protein
MRSYAMRSFTTRDGLMTVVRRVFRSPLMG